MSSHRHVSDEFLDVRSVLAKSVVDFVIRLLHHQRVAGPCTAPAGHVLKAMRTTWQALARANGSDRGCNRAGQLRWVVRRRVVVRCTVELEFGDVVTLDADVDFVLRCVQGADTRDS